MAISEDEADQDFSNAGLIPIAPYTGRNHERAARCVRCGTTRFVRLSNLRIGSGYPCRWCHGWERAGLPAPHVDDLPDPIEVAASGTPDAREMVTRSGKVPLTLLGDARTTFGFRCQCGETGATTPVEAVGPWDQCPRCELKRKQALKHSAGPAFLDAGLRLLDIPLGRYIKYAAECQTCGSVRHVSVDQVESRTVPPCYWCTHGIVPDEPHRVYLFRFPALGVLKIGITHNRHNRRLFDHADHGGELVDIAEVPNRAAARAVETWVLAAKEPWLRHVGPDQFPQGGWTEAWLEKGSGPVDLHALCTQLGHLNA